MKEKQALAERYADLLIDWQNPALAQVVHELDNTYSAPCSPEYLTWKNLQTRQAHIEMEGERPRSTPHILFRPAFKFAPRLSIAITVLLIALLAAGTVYAQMSGLIDVALNRDPGAQQLEKNNQFVTTSTSQTVQGFTVTLQKTYADENRVIVGYSIETPTDHTYEVSDDGKLYVDQATNPSVALTQLAGVGAGQDSDHSTAYVDTFNASRIQGHPDTIHLRFTITHLQVFILDTTINEINKSQHAQKHVPFHPPSFSVNGHIQFDVTVPLHKSTSIHVGQQQSGVTLDHVAISQSEVLVYLQGVQYEQFNVATLSVTSGNSTKQYKWQNADGESYAGGTIIVFPDALANAPGDWTLTLTPGTPVQKTGNTLVFHFTVPQQ